MHIIDIEAMLQFQLGKKVSPVGSNLSSHIHPESFYPYIVNTPVIILY